MILLSSLYLYYELMINIYSRSLNIFFLFIIKINNDFFYIMTNYIVTKNNI